MKVTLYMAVTIDGFIAKKDGDSDWVSPIDSAIFEQKIKEMGCIIVGRRTFDQYQNDLYPVKGVTNIVITSNSSFKSREDNVVYALSPIEAIKLAQEKGHDKALLIGGGTTNGIFLKEGLIDEIYIDVHPLLLGSGIKLFESFTGKADLEFVDSKNLQGGLVLLHYKMKK